MSKEHSSQHQPRPFNFSAKVDNLIKNGDFSGSFDHWVVDDAGNPENCIAGSYSAQLKNNGNITQTVQVERATPYILRFDAGGPFSSRIAHVLEDGVVTHTIYIGPNHMIHSFVTRENTSQVGIRFTGLTEDQFYVWSIILLKDIPDPEELVQNGDFDFGYENWETNVAVQIFDGHCDINAGGLAYQVITGLVPGATYRIRCNKLPTENFQSGHVYVQTSGARIQVIELNRNVHEYLHEIQITEDSVRLEMDGNLVSYDSISMKRISVSS